MTSLSRIGTKSNPALAALQASEAASFAKEISLLGGLPPSILLSGLQLARANRAIEEKLNQIRATNEQRKAYNDQLAQVRAQIDQLPPDAESGEVFGKPVQLDFGPDGKPIGGGQLLDGATHKGYGLVNSTPDANGVKHPYRTYEGGPGWDSESKARFDIGSKDYENEVVVFKKGIGLPFPWRAGHPDYRRIDENWIDNWIKENGITGVEVVDVYNVSRSALEHEVNRLNDRIADLNSANEIAQVELERLIKQSQQITEFGQKVLSETKEGRRTITANV